MAKDEDIKGFIRCKNCGKTYVVSGDEVYEEDNSYHCNECGEDFDVPFFTYCHECEAVVGVDNGSVSDALIGIAESAIG